MNLEVSKDSIWEIIEVWTRSIIDTKEEKLEEEVEEEVEEEDVE